LTLEIGGCWKETYAIALAVVVAVVEERVSAACRGAGDRASSGGDATDKAADGASNAVEVDLALEDIASEASSSASDGTGDRLEGTGDGLESTSDGLKLASDGLEGTSDRASGASNTANEAVNSAGDTTKVQLTLEKISSEASGGTGDGLKSTSDRLKLTSDGLESTSSGASDASDAANKAAGSASNTTKVQLTLQDISSSACDRLDSIGHRGGGVGDRLESASGSVASTLEGASDLAEEGDELGLAQLADVKVVGNTTANEAIDNRNAVGQAIGGRANSDTVKETTLAVSDATDDGSSNRDAIEVVKKSTLSVVQDAAAEGLEVEAVAAGSRVAVTSLVVVAIAIASSVSVAVVLAVAVAVALDEVVVAGTGVGDRAEGAGDGTKKVGDASNLRSRGCEDRGGESNDANGDGGTHVGGWSFVGGLVDIKRDKYY